VKLVVGERVTVVETDDGSYRGLEKCFDALGSDAWLKSERGMAGLRLELSEREAMGAMIGRVEVRDAGRKVGFKSTTIEVLRRDG
jgi:hypothetical protein